MGPKIVKCPHCGTPIARTAQVCPRCGGPNKVGMGLKTFVAICLMVLGVAVIAEYLGLIDLGLLSLL